MYMFTSGWKSLRPLELCPMTPCRRSAPERRFYKKLFSQRKAKMGLRSVTVLVQVCLMAQAWMVRLMMMMPGTADVQILSIAVTKVFSNLHGLNLHGLDRRRRNYHPRININFYKGNLASASATDWRNLLGKGVLSSACYLEKLLSHRNVFLGVAPRPVRIESVCSRLAPARRQSCFDPGVSLQTTPALRALRRKTIQNHTPL